MEEQLITFETAKLAKEKGFDLLTKGSYIKEKLDISMSCKNGFDDILFTSAPTQSLLQKWLRDVHNKKVFLTPIRNLNNGDYRWSVGLYEYTPTINTYDTYEDALEKGLQYALNLITI